MLLALDYQSIKNLGGVSMFQTDTITFQTSTEVNTNGSIKLTWSADGTVLCDVQYISKEKVNKDYGFTDANEWIQVFDLTLSSKWDEGKQVLYDGNSYLVRKVIPNQAKISASNHIYVVLSRVI